MKIAVLVSGGVDSSVALHLLQAQGHDVTAFYLKIWLEDELSFLGTCPWQEDLAYVQQVCAQAQVPLEVISLQQAYWDYVVKYTLDEVKAGRTPNPDVWCNRRIKFGMFLEYLDRAVPGVYDKVASGHYAQVVQRDGGYDLVCAPDPIKDQTYFLSYLTQAQLSRIVFPIGQFTKEQVRAYAHAHDIPTKDRKDSQGICFLGKISFHEFIKYHLGEQEGALVEWESKNVVGKHTGSWFYTIGQRQGIGLGGGPWYVVAKDMPNNTVFISRSYYAHDKVRNSFTITACNWIRSYAPTTDTVRLKLRHGPLFHQAHIELLPNDRVYVTLADRDQGIASGQFAALYEEAVCLGSGVVE